jgi:hypothetical protein
MGVKDPATLSGDPRGCPIPRPARIRFGHVHYLETGAAQQGRQLLRWVMGVRTLFRLVRARLKPFRLTVVEGSFSIKYLTPDNHLFI